MTSELSSKWFDGDAVAKGFEGVNEAVLSRRAVPQLEVVDAEIDKGLVFLKDVVGDDEDGMADGNSGFLLAPAGDEAMILSGEVGVATPGGVSSFSQGDSQPGGASTRLAAPT